MSYDKLSLASFQEALKSGKYQSPAGARRAVGKAATLSEADKDKARKLIDAHFGADGATKPKPAKPAKTGARRTKASVKQQVEVAPKRRGRPKKVAAAVADTGFVPVEHVAELAQPGVAMGFDIENLGSIGTQIRIAEKTITQVSLALSSLTNAKDKYPDADLGGVIEEMGNTLSGAVGIFRSVVHNISSQGSEPKVSKRQPAPAQVSQPAPAPVAQTANNGLPPSRAESLFRDSQPETAAPAEG